MFETAEVGHKADKKTWNAEAPRIRQALLKVQKDLAGSPLSVVVLVGGVEGAGKSETVNLLLDWMDARGIQTHAIGEPSDEEMERPPLWRFWRRLPPKGRIGIFLGSWYTAPILNRVLGRSKRAEFEITLDRIVELERMLTDEGTLLVKLWMHISKAAQRKRLKSLESDPDTAWRVTKTDWKYFERYDDFREVCEAALRRTGTGHAPWHVIEAADARWRGLTVTRRLLESMRKAIPAARRTEQMLRARRRPSLPKPEPTNILRALDLTLALDDRAYEKRLVKAERAVGLLTRRMYENRRSMILVFEGPDAAGKGGAIRRLTSAIDARLFQVTSVAAPTDEERAHPYLWRFWRHLPRLGRVTIYDRSWYGRVLVERVEGFCAPQEWSRAYGEINAFESQLTEFGIVVMKFWLAITPDEQLRRFRDRQTTPYKQYKITEEDWRNRAKSGAYEAAACEMIEKTSTSPAPWILVEANDKNWARIKIMRAVAGALETALGA